jgi:hypothetical protein
VSRATPGAIGGYAFLPQHPVYRGDTITVYLYAQTGANDLSGVDFTIAYDTNAFVGAIVSAPLYSAPVIGSNTNMQLSVTLGRNAGALASEVTGWFQFASVTLTVSAAAVGMNSSFSVVSGQFVNSGAVPWASSQAYLLADQREGWSSPGQVVVANPAVIGIYATAAASTIVDTSTLTGAAVSTSLSTLQYYGTGRAYAWFADAAVTPTSCSAGAGFSVMPVASGCAVTASGASSSSVVTATAAGFTSPIASLRVYRPLATAHYATRSTLRKRDSARSMNSGSVITISPCQKQKNQRAACAWAWPPLCY